MNELFDRVEEDVKIVSLLYETMLPIKPVTCSEDYLKHWVINKVCNFSIEERNAWIKIINQQNEK